MDRHARISVTNPPATSTPAQSRPGRGDQPWRGRHRAGGQATADHVDVPFAGAPAPEPAGAR
ncbi:hypothetical protein ACQRWP_12670 [Micromonospora trifolii]|uniref:hypothetical protein n=1 Tax=Micromonospora trifolii TaxID=2911208 RepID=UPI003D2F427E